MVKKVFSLVMVISILGGILAGCSKPAEETTTPPAASGDAPATK